MPRSQGLTWFKSMVREDTEATELWDGESDRRGGQGASREAEDCLELLSGVWAELRGGERG